MQWNLQIIIVGDLYSKTNDINKIYDSYEEEEAIQDNVHTNSRASQDDFLYDFFYMILSEHSKKYIVVNSFGHKLLSL